MALPAGLAGFTLTFGSYGDAVGSPVLKGMTGQLVPVDATGKPTKLRHRSTGEAIIPTPVTVTIDELGRGSVGPLPHTDDPALTPTGFLYWLQWRSFGRPSPGDLTFAVPLAAGATVHFDDLEESTDAPGIMVPIGIGPPGPPGPQGPPGSPAGGSFVPFGATPPDPDTAPVWVDTTTTPPIIRYWTGSTWVALPIVTGVTTTATDNGDGTGTVSGSAVMSNSDGTYTISDLADNGDGTFTIAA